jgi:hypothetical protein
MQRNGKTIRRVGAAILTIASVVCTGVARADTLGSGGGVSATQLAAGDAAIENPASLPGKSTLTAEDEKFLDDMERRGIQYFVDYSDPVTGLMPDRGKADGSGPAEIASTAAVGFGLTALCVGDYHGWVPHQQAYDLSLRVLEFLRDHAPQNHGLFYHFLNMRTGEREWNCEVSDIDTALLMAGVLTARQHFAGTELAKVADELYGRVDWPWMLSSDGTLYMGWKPDVHFYANWRDFNEGPLLYLLAMGSASHPLKADAWRAWKREPVITYSGLTYMQCPPLFTHQYPQVWFDLRGVRDDYADYYENSQLATIAQRQWTIDELSKRASTYGPNMWGLTASDVEDGYDALGGPPRNKEEKISEKINGIVMPTAAGGSMAFEPRLCLDDLEAMRASYGTKAYLKYGFVDAFNPTDGWYDKDVLGIDIGPMVLMAENCRSGFVWKTFMSSPEAQAALKAAGFRALEASDNRPTTSLFNANETAGNGG